MGRVEIATLRVSARLKEGKGEEEGRKIPPRPISSSLLEFQQAKQFVLPKKAPELQA